MNQALYSLPRYEQIKTFIRNQIDSGQWRSGDRVPSENQLSMDFSVSRMTARRALQELADENLLLRSPGLGTFVAEPRAAAPLLEIADFSRQFSFSNPEYSNRVLSLQEISGETTVSSVLGLGQGDRLFQSTVVHCINSAAVQWEHCYINPAEAPAFLKQNFARVTPQAYLDWAAPASRVEHQVQAVVPDSDISGALGLPTTSPCLKVSRRNWRGDRVVSVSLFIYPGSFSLGTELMI